MGLMTKKGTNKYEFTDNLSFYLKSEWSKSQFFNSEDIPNYEFNMLARIAGDKQSIDIRVQKSDLRAAVAVVKVQLDRQRPMISCVVDWKRNVDFNNFIFSLAVDEYLKKGCGSSFNKYVTVSCSIFWFGFVEDFYCSYGCRHVENYYKSNEFSDMVIIVDDNKFPAHQNILARQSSIFRDMLTSNLKKSGENSISFPGVDVKIIKEMILFFYQNRLDDAEKDEEMALKLVKFAAMYQIDYLKTACEYLLVKNLKIDNVFDLYSVAKDCNLTTLQQHAITLIKNNIFEMGVIPEKSKDEFALHHKFKLNYQRHKEESITLNTADTIDVPDTEFTFFAQINNHKNLHVKIEKSDQRSAVVIIKVQIGNQKPIICQLADWKKTVNFNNDPIPLTLDVLNGHEYEIPINFSVLWQGYIEDVYHLDVCNRMKNYYDNTEFSDLKLSVEDSEFPAHKNVLAKHSPVFYKMLTSDMKESKENRIYFPDADVGTIKEMLLFFYQHKLDEANKDEEMVIKLFHFSSMYQIDKLKTACEYILITSLKIENVFNRYSFAKNNNSSILQQHALIFIENNAFEMLDVTCEELKK